jgi:hypothetical protein
MTLNFLHPGTGSRDIPPAVPHGPAEPDSRPVDWRAARRADRACCCIAKPTVIVLMPPAADRPHQTDLLLCGHHYRMSEQALAAVNATVLDLNSLPAPASEERSAAPV